MRIPFFPRTVISSASEKSFSFAVMKEMGGHRKTGNTVLHTLRDRGVSCRQEKANGQRKSALGCVWEDDMRKCSLPIPFYSAARANLRPFGAPPSIGRRESCVPAPKPFPRGKKAMREYRFPRAVISSASEKSFSFAVKKKRESIGKWETPYSIRSGITVFHLGIKNPLKQFGYLSCLL